MADLRIVDDVAWQAAKARQVAARKAVEFGTSGWRSGQVVRAQRPLYLFSGLTKCGVCGAGIILSSRDTLRCHALIAKSTCTNARSIKRQELDARALRALKDRFFEPGAFAECCAAFTAETNRLRMEQRAGLTNIKRELAQVQRGIQKVIEGIKAGFDLTELNPEMDALVAFGKRDLQLPVVIDQPSHAGNRAVGRDGDALARHQVRIVGRAERTGIRRAELREMKTIEDVAAGGEPVGFRRQLRRFDERPRALLPHPVAIPFRFAALDVDRVGPDFVDGRGVGLGFRIELRRGLHARDGQRPARERLVGPEPRHAGPRRQPGGERRDGRDRTGQQHKSTHHAPQSSKSFGRSTIRVRSNVTVWTVIGLLSDAGPLAV